jgi:CelD/BcsL family acetyltransferase involved in cellulose biosynthesis
LQSLSANTRQNVRRKLRKFQQQGGTITQVPCDDAAARTAALQSLFAYHQLRWEDDSSGGVFKHEQDRLMHHHLASNLAARGWLDLRVAKSAAGQIVGVIYNFRRNGVGYYYQLGFNNENAWTAYSLGFCLLADSILAAIGSGCHTFDLLRGDHEYKSHFGGQLTRNFRVTIYRYGWLPALENAVRTLRTRLRPVTALQPSAQPVSE